MRNFLLGMLAGIILTVSVVNGIAKYEELNVKVNYTYAYVQALDQMLRSQR